MGILAFMKKSLTIERIGEWWWNLLQDSMKEAGAKEKALEINIIREYQQ